MSSLFNHAFIPIVILLIFSSKLKINPKNILILGFFAILPDIDIYFNHRASFHNIFILIIPILIFIFIRNKIENKIEISGIISFYLISHIILDIFNGGVFLLYPFYNDVLFVRTDIRFDDNIFNYGINDKIVNIPKIGESIISSENTGTLILLMIIVLIVIIKKFKDNEVKR